MSDQMDSRQFILEYMQQYFTEIEPMEFYRDIFPEGELERQGEYEKGKYNAIAVELLPVKKKDERQHANRYTLTDGLEKLPDLLKSENFIIISPISYAGKERSSKNARFIYALAIDLDGIDTQQNLTDLFHQINKVEFLPRPTFCVCSGNGLHLYYKFERPVPCFTNIVKQMQKMKEALTRKIWNGFVTALEDKVQFQSLFQGFRLVGGVTKDGNRTKAFRTGDYVTIDYLNDFVPEDSQVAEFAYKSKLTLKQAEEKYPEWFDRRIRQKQKKGTWTCKRDLYDWWKRRLETEIVTGHRYFGVMCLAIYAKKSGIDQEELERDAYGMVDRLEKLTTDENNHFTRADVLEALEAYNDDYITYPIDSIERVTDLKIERNRRNGRKQRVHLMGARAIQAINDAENGTDWREGNGRKPKKREVRLWQMKHPQGTKNECIHDTGLSRSTVYKWWL